MNGRPDGAREDVPTLFEVGPSCRADGPETSALAAGRHSSSGKRQANLARVLAVVKSHPGLTFREIHAHMPMIREPIEVSLLLTDLKFARRVVRGPSRLCSISPESECWTWYVAGAVARGDA